MMSDTWPEQEIITGFFDIYKIEMSWKAQLKLQQDLTKIRTDAVSSLTTENTKLQAQLKERIKECPSHEDCLRDQARIEELGEKFGDDLFLQSRITKAVESIEPIETWCKAYPLDVFIEPTKEQWKAVDSVLKTNGYALTAISASNMRHVLKGVEKYVYDALAALTDEEVKGEN